MQENFLKTGFRNIAADVDPVVYNLSVYKEYIIGYLPQLILTFTSDNTQIYIKCYFLIITEKIIDIHSYIIQPRFLSFSVRNKDDNIHKSKALKW